MLTIDGPSSARSVGTAPWAAAKFEEVGKKQVSSCEPEKAVEIIKKSSEPCAPVINPEIDWQTQG